MTEILGKDRANEGGKIRIDKKFAAYPIFDFKFKKVDWQLNERNIEKRRDDIDIDGVIFVRAYDEAGDFKTRVITECDIADGLYVAMEEVEEFLEDGWPAVEVHYTTLCQCYGAGKSYEYGQEFGYVLSSFLGCDSNWFSYDIGTPVICRTVGDDWEDIWIADDLGDFSLENVDVDIDTLIAYQKSPESMAGKIEWI